MHIKRHQLSSLNTDISSGDTLSVALCKATFCPMDILSCDTLSDARFVRWIFVRLTGSWPVGEHSGLDFTRKTCFFFSVSSNLGDPLNQVGVYRTKRHRTNFPADRHSPHKDSPDNVWSDEISLYEISQRSHSPYDQKNLESSSTRTLNVSRLQLWANLHQLQFAHSLPTRSQTCVLKFFTPNCDFCTSQIFHITDFTDRDKEVQYHDINLEI